MVNAPKDRVGFLLQQCRQMGLRRTECLRAILKCLVEREIPISVQQLLATEELQGRCDPATVYRLLARLETRNVIRRVGLPKRSAHYILNDAAVCRTYAVCVDCGRVEIVNVGWPDDAVLDSVGKQTGFHAAYHEAQFYGTCPDCQASGFSGRYAQFEEVAQRVAEESHS